MARALWCSLWHLHGLRVGTDSHTDGQTDCIIHFLLPSQAYYLTDVGITEFGFLINTSIVVVVSLHLAVETLHWVSQSL